MSYILYYGYTYYTCTYAAAAAVAQCIVYTLQCIKWARREEDSVR